MAESADGPRVAIVTGGSQGIGAAVVDGYRQRGWAVVVNARTMKPSADPNLVTIAGDVSQPATAEAIVAAALGRFGRVDTLVNNAGVFMSKPFTDYTAADYALITGVNRAHQGRAGRRHRVARHRVRVPRYPGQRRLAGHHPDVDAPARELRQPR